MLPNFMDDFISGRFLYRPRLLSEKPYKYILAHMFYSSYVLKTHHTLQGLPEDLLRPLGPPGLSGLPGPPGLPSPQDHQDHQDQQDQQGTQDRQGLQDYQDYQDHQDYQDPQDHQGKTPIMDALEAIEIAYRGGIIMAVKVGDKGYNES